MVEWVLWCSALRYVLSPGPRNIFLSGYRKKKTVKKQNLGSRQHNRIITFILYILKSSVKWIFQAIGNGKFMNWHGRTSRTVIHLFEWTGNLPLLRQLVSPHSSEPETKIDSKTWFKKMHKVNDCLRSFGLFWPVAWGSFMTNFVTQEYLSQITKKATLCLSRRAPNSLQ